MYVTRMRDFLIRNNPTLRLRGISRSNEYRQIIRCAGRCTRTETAVNCHEVGLRNYRVPKKKIIRANNVIYERYEAREN